MDPNQRFLDSAGARTQQRVLTILRVLEVVGGIIAAVALLTACGGEDKRPDVAPQILNAIVTYFVGIKGLQFYSANVQPGTDGKPKSNKSVDRHKGYFVRRRANFLGKHNTAWVSEPDQPRLKARIDNE